MGKSKKAPSEASKKEEPLVEPEPAPEEPPAPEPAPEPELVVEDVPVPEQQEEKPPKPKKEKYISPPEHQLKVPFQPILFLFRSFNRLIIMFYIHYN